MDYLEELWNLFELEVKQGGYEQKGTNPKMKGYGSLDTQIKSIRKPQPKPPLREPDDVKPPNVGTPDKGYQNQRFQSNPKANPTLSPQAAKAQQRDALIKQGMPPGEAHERIDGPVDLGDPSQVGRAAASFGKTQSDQSSANSIKYDKDSQSLAAKDNEERANEALPTQQDAMSGQNAERPDEDQENVSPPVPETSERGAEGTEDKLDRLDDGELSDEEQYENDMEQMDDDLSKWQSEVDEYIDDLIGQKGELTDRQRKAVDKKYGAIRERLKNIKGEATQNTMRQAMALGSTYVGRVNSGAGKNSIGMIDHESLLANEDRLVSGYGDGSPEAIKKFVDSVRTVEVDDQTVSDFYDLLPEKLQNFFNKAGDTGSGYKGHFLGYNEDGSIKRGGTGNRDRGLVVARLLLQQGFRDAYTGLPLDPNKIDLEHVVGFNNSDNGKPTQEDWDNRENLDNFVIIASNINQTKRENNMSDFLNGSVHTLDNYSEEDFQTRDDLFSDANRITSTAAKVGKFFVNDNKLTTSELRKLPLDELLAPSVTKENFDAYNKNDRKLVSEINKQLKAFAKGKNMKAKDAPKVENRLSYDLFKNLGITTSIPKPPTFDKDGVMKKPGRGSQSKFDDRIYSAVLSTALGDGKENLRKFKDRWNEQIKNVKDYMNTYNPDGESGYRFFINNIIKEGLIDKSFLEDEDFAKLLKEEYGVECGEFLTEGDDIDYNDDVDYLRTYGRA